MTSSQPFDHNRDYYASFTPPYETLHPVWNDHFGRAVQQVVEQINPTSIIDAGCAVGVLVRQFAMVGVNALGFDSSPDAITIATESDPGLVDKVLLHDISKPFPHTADAVICIEVLEHLEESLAASAVATLCRSALKWVVFSSTPDDVDSPQHPNVQLPPYWDALFEANGFAKTEIPATNFCGWAIVYKRVRPIEDDLPENVNELSEVTEYNEDSGDKPDETKEFPALQDVAPGESLTPTNLEEAPAKKSRKKKSEDG